MIRNLTLINVCVYITYVQPDQHCGTHFNLFFFFIMSLVIKILTRILQMHKIQEVFHVYLNKFEIAVSHLFLIIFINNKFTVVNQISRNAQSPRKYILTLYLDLNRL